VPLSNCALATFISKASKCNVLEVTGRLQIIQDQDAKTKMPQLDRVKNT
jgi:hypothetical protein